jgi:hypothetical protein
VVVSILAFAAASVLTATLFHLVEGDTGIGGIAVSAGLLFAVASISWAISAGLKRRRAGDPPGRGAAPRRRS